MHIQRALHQERLALAEYQGLAVPQEQAELEERLETTDR